MARTRSIRVFEVLHDLTVPGAAGDYMAVRRFRKRADAAEFAATATTYGKPASVTECEAPLRLAQRWGSMSAFLCDDCHLTALASFALQEKTQGYLAGPDASYHARHGEPLQTLGQRLKDENAANLYHLYGDRADDSPETWIGPFEPCRHAHHARVEPVAMLKAIACYEYQCCDRPEWKDSDVRSLLSRMRSAAIARLPGYEQAAWGYDCKHPTGAR